MENSPETEEEKKKLGCLPYAIGGASFIPLLGIPLGLIAIVWGIVKRKEGGVPLAILGLCGISLTIGLYGTLFYKGFVEKGGVFEELRGNMAQSLLNDLIPKVEYYKIINGNYPDSLEQIMPKEQDMNNFTFIYEPFVSFNSNQQTFQYELVNDGLNYSLFSYGPDRIVGTADDIYPVLPDEEKAQLGYIKLSEQGGEADPIIHGLLENEPHN